MELLQIGDENWIKEYDVPDGIVWYHTIAEELEEFLDNLYKKKLSELPPRKKDAPLPKINLYFNAVFLTSSVKEEQLNHLQNCVESYGVFYDRGVQIFSNSDMGFVRQKCPQELTVDGEREKKLAFLQEIVFPGQYGAKLKIGDIDIAPHFKGDISYNGNVNVVFEGDFGVDYTPLFTYRYNVSIGSNAIELWQEFIKQSDCELKLEITPIVKGGVSALKDSIVRSEEQMQTPIIIVPEEGIGSYAVSVLAKGSGNIKFGPLHWRLSRQGYGSMVLGGRTLFDRKRQEVLTYFNPADLKPPLNVYFSGYRSAEGFEGFGMMKSLKAPFLLIADPRLEGGSFYSGTQELEDQVAGRIQEALDYLGFNSSQLILSGISMGSFGALYYASKFNPYGVVVGKPFTNLGDTVLGMKLKRPDEFETVGDVLLNIMGDYQEEDIEKINEKFWSQFKLSSFNSTQFAFAFMENDDYDGSATKKMINYFSTIDSHIFAKGYLGRHNDNSLAISKWFRREYSNMLEKGFGRKF